jgi:hypothetical protein
MNFYLIATHGENRNKTKMKIRTVNVYFMIIGSAGVTHIFCVEIPANPDPPDSEYKKHFTN